MGDGYDDVSNVYSDGVSGDGNGNGVGGVYNDDAMDDVYDIVGSFHH